MNLHCLELYKSLYFYKHGSYFLCSWQSNATLVSERALISPLEFQVKNKLHFVETQPQEAMILASIKMTAWAILRDALLMEMLTPRNSENIHIKWNVTWLFQIRKINLKKILDNSCVWNMSSSQSHFSLQPDHNRWSWEYVLCSRTWLCHEDN